MVAQPLVWASPPLQPQMVTGGCRGGIGDAGLSLGNMQRISPRFKRSSTLLRLRQKRNWPLENSKGNRTHSLGMCNMGTGFGTRPPMSDNQQMVHCVAVSLTTRRGTDGQSCSTVALLGTICSGGESTGERLLNFSSVAEDGDAHWRCQILSHQKAIYGYFFSALMPQRSTWALNGRRTA
jgi:hypothetical protein